MRSFCFGCSRQCQDRNNRLMLDFQAQNNPSMLQHACFATDLSGTVTGASQYRNVVCDSGCNNLECDYDGNDCTQSQILAHCNSQTAALTFTQAQRSTSYDTQPTTRLVQLTVNESVMYNATATIHDASVQPRYVTASLVPVNFQIELTETLRLLLDGEFNEVVLLQAFRYYLQWEDERIFNHPCYGALQQTLSISRAAAESETARYDKYTRASQFWIPSLELPGKAAGTSTWDELANVELNASMPWRGNIGPSWAQRPFAPATSTSTVVSQRWTTATGTVLTDNQQGAISTTQMCTWCVQRTAEKEVKVRTTAKPNTNCLLAISLSLSDLSTDLLGMAACARCRSSCPISITVRHW
jgi:hypothetical protein